MQTYLNEIYNHIDTNKHAYNETFISDKKDKNKYNQNSKNINKKINNLSKTKSGLFLNNFFRSDKKTSKTLNNNHNKNKNTNKKINVNPYQKIGNKYILNYALDNLNKYQQNLLIKENENTKVNNPIKNKLKCFNDFNNYILDNNININVEEKIPEPEPYIINKYVMKTHSFNNNFNKSNINININKRETSKNSTTSNSIKKYQTNKNIDIKLNFTLSNLELNELKNIFEEHYIFFEDLFLLTKEDFKEMKIPIGPRNRLLNFIKKYKNYAKTFDLNELSLFMNKYKESIKSNNNTLIETPSSANDKYNTAMTTEYNKNKNYSENKELNYSSLEERDNINQNKIKNQDNDIYLKKNNKIYDNLNDIISSANNMNYINCEIKNNIKDDKEDYEINENKNKIINDNNNGNISPQNIFSNSLFNDFTSYGASDIKESDNLNIQILNNKNEKNNINTKNNNKNKRSQSGYYKNYNNIFNEIEKYQINYEKMKKENDERNNKINSLLEKKNKNNLMYLKLKLKNSKFYNEEDLKNESIRDLNKELEKINIIKNKDNDKFEYKKKKNSKNPLIEEYNKFK